MWVSLLDAAETWGKAPWEIGGQKRREDQLVWFVRWQFYREQKAIRKRELEEQAERKNRRG